MYFVCIFYTRSQAEHFSNSASRLSSVQAGVSEGARQTAEKLSAIETRLRDGEKADPTAQFAARGALTTLQSIEDKVETRLKLPPLTHLGFLFLS